ncbi:hypothetical protein B0H14DRAFT_3906314 [Mycena olivaceomarginata]|nr:hypothetical protein B0H14DRAFT_3906314 [Mycena olivaceomarginata]
MSGVESIGPFIVSSLLNVAIVGAVSCAATDITVSVSGNEIWNPDARDNPRTRNKEVPLPPVPFAHYRPFNDDTPVEEQSCIYVPLCAPGTRVRALLLSIPTGSVAETTPSERFGSTFSNPVFHIPDSTIQRCSCVEVGDRRNPGHQPALPSICQDHGEESFHLDDLPFASPHGKADPDEGQSSSADI